MLATSERGNETCLIVLYGLDSMVPPMCDFHVLGLLLIQL